MIGIAGRARSGMRSGARTHNLGLCLVHLQLKPNFKQKQRNMPTTTKLTSIRLDEEVLQKIEEFVKVHRYWNRSGVINNLLWSILHNFDNGEVYDMVRTPLYRGYEVDCHYKITEYKKKQGGKENG